VSVTFGPYDVGVIDKSLAKRLYGEDVALDCKLFGY
jgi:hypothetical protein